MEKELYNFDFVPSIDSLNIPKTDVDYNFKKEYLSDKEGNSLPYLKKDIAERIDIYTPYTFFPILKELDIPFFEEQWFSAIEHFTEMRKNIDIRRVIFYYISKMKLHDFKNFDFNSSDLKFKDKKDYYDFRYEIK